MIIGNFNKCIRQIEKQVINSDKDFAEVSIEILNLIINYVSEKIVSVAIRLVLLNGNKTIMSTDIETAVHLVMDGHTSLGKHAILEARKILDKENYDCMSISEMRKIFRNNVVEGLKTSKKSIIYLCGVMDYLTGEIIELAKIESTKDRKEREVSIVNIMDAIDSDDEIKDLLGNVYVLGSGVKRAEYSGGNYVDIYPDDNAIKTEFNIEEKVKGGSNPYRISNSGLDRLMYKAGVKYHSGLIYEEIRFFMNEFLEKIVKKVVSIADSKKLKTISFEMGVEALRISNIKVFATKGYPGRIEPCKGMEDLSKLKNKRSKKSRKENLLNKIKKYQKTECTLLQHAPVVEMIKDTVKDFSSNNKKMYSVDFLWLYHAILEDYTIRLLQDAYRCTLHTKRETLYPKDIKLAMIIRNE